MLKENYIYIVGIVISFFAILFANYWAYKKITIEDFFLAILGSIFSWGTAILIPIFIISDNAKFLDKTVFGKKSQYE